MPLVDIHMVKGSRTPEEIREVAEIVQEVMLLTFDVPPRDRLQVISQHEPYEMICEDTILGFARTDKLLIVHVFHKTRTTAAKQIMYSELMKRLGDRTGLKGGDLVISCSANTDADWSFGEGRAQFMTGEL